MNGNNGGVEILLSKISNTYTLLESSNLLAGHGVTLGNDRNQVDLLVQSLHELNVQGLEGVAGGGNEIKASIDTGIGDLATVHSVLLFKICVKSTFDRLQDGFPAKAVTQKNVIKSTQKGPTSVSPSIIM
jgi:hypothetical protein